VTGHIAASGESRHQRKHHIGKKSGSDDGENGEAKTKKRQAKKTSIMAVT